MRDEHSQKFIGQERPRQTEDTNQKRKATWTTIVAPEIDLTACVRACSPESALEASRKRAETWVGKVEARQELRERALAAHTSVLTIMNTDHLEMLRLCLRCEAVSEDRLRQFVNEDAKTFFGKAPPSLSHTGNIYLAWVPHNFCGMSTGGKPCALQGKRCAKIGRSIHPFTAKCLEKCCIRNGTVVQGRLEFYRHMSGDASLDFEFLVQQPRELHSWIAERYMFS